MGGGVRSRGVRFAAVVAALVLLSSASAFARPDADPNKSCATCHTEIGQEWNGSLHRKAWIDPVFQSAYEIEPLAFCRGCHAPMSDPARKTPTARAQHDGVGCVTCHVGSDHKIKASHQPAAAYAMHAVTVDPQLATQAACASCHQFDFPSHSGQLTAEPMQDTVTEHARSTKSDTPCQSCHMPLVDDRTSPRGKHRSHDFRVLGDTAILQKAITARAERLDAQRLQVTLEAAEIGHSFPTGDMFRRVEVRAEALDARGVVVARTAPAILERTFGDRPRRPNSPADVGSERVEISDTRVPPPGRGVRTIELRFATPPPTARIRWSVIYQRMPSPMATAFRVDQAIDEVVVAQGELAPQLAQHTGGTL